MNHPSPTDPPDAAAFSAPPEAALPPPPAPAAGAAPAGGPTENVGIRFVVALPDGRHYSLSIDSRRALIGSGAHCEVRLEPDLAAPEHVEVIVDRGIIYVQALAGEPMPLLDGVPISQNAWPQNSVLSIGAVQIAAEVVDLSDTKKRTNPFWLLLVIPLFAVAGVLAYLRTTTTAPYVFPPAPPLFDEPITRCPQQGGDTVMAYAQERRRIALAQRERSPFAPRDALDAVPNFELAAACFRAAGDSEDADASASAAATLRRKEEDEYRVRRVRLEHAYLEVDVDAMDRETQVLGPMTAHRSGPYVEWLGNVIRRVKLKKGEPRKGFLQ